MDNYNAQQRDDFKAGQSLFDRHTLFSEENERDERQSKQNKNRQTFQYRNKSLFPELGHISGFLSAEGGEGEKGLELQTAYIVKAEKHEYDGKQSNSNLSVYFMGKYGA